MNKILIILINTFMISSCALLLTTTEDYETYLNSLIGLSETQLIQTVGAPTQTYKTDEAKFLIYYKEISNYSIADAYSNTGVYQNTYNNNMYLGTNTTAIQSNYKEYCETTFTIVDNKVVHYLFKGNRCNKLVTKEQVNKINKK